MKKNKDKVLSILADIYYSQATVTWNQLQDMALFLKENYKLGPKGTKEVSKVLQEVYNMINVRYKKNHCLCVDDEGKFLSLADIIGYYHYNCFDAVAIKFSRIDKLIKNLWPIQSYIDKIANDVLFELFYLNSPEAFQAVNNILGYDIRAYANPNVSDECDRLNLGAEDKYRFAKKTKNYLEKLEKKPIIPKNIEPEKTSSYNFDKKVNHNNEVKQELKTQKIEAQEKVLAILADIIYSNKTFSWYDCMDMALFLYKNNRLASNYIKDIAAILYRIFDICKNHYLNDSDLVVDANGNFQSLAYIIKNDEEIQNLFIKIKNSIKDYSVIQSYIDSLANKSLVDLTCLSSTEAYLTIENILGYDIREKVVLNAQNDCERLKVNYRDKYSFAKATKTYLNMQKRASLTIVQLEALKDMTISEERKKYLQNCILDIEDSFKTGKISLIEEEVFDAEDIFTRSLKR